MPEQRARVVDLVLRAYDIGLIGSLGVSWLRPAADQRA
jgi:hypothetical protein